METASQFDLGSALQHWLDQLGQSPQVKAENLKELESHVRDSVVRLQSQGLSFEESFLIATHRVGSPAKLEPEFAKVNRSPWNMIAHGLILIFFSVCCWFLWGILQLPRMMMPYAKVGVVLPAFTAFMMGCGKYLAVPPTLAAVYWLYVWARESQAGNSWIGFLVITLAVLDFLSLPILIAAFLPVIGFMDHLPAKIFQP